MGSLSKNNWNKIYHNYKLMAELKEIFYYYYKYGKYRIQSSISVKCRVLAQLLKLIKVAGYKNLFVELKIVWIDCVIWQSELKMYHEQCQTKKLSSKGKRQECKNVFNDVNSKGGGQILKFSCKIQVSNLENLKHEFWPGSYPFPLKFLKWGIGVVIWACLNLTRSL